MNNSELLWRALAPRPRLLLLDEPLGALDRALRERLMLELREILTSRIITALYVTHDQTEAFAVADRVAVMNGGQVEQVATRLTFTTVRLTHLSPDSWVSRTSFPAE
ncbi:MAG: hypothetical protein R3C44_22905 [Chloroflexota bacterium]